MRDREALQRELDAVAAAGQDLHADLAAMHEDLVELRQMLLEQRAELQRHREWLTGASAELRRLRERRT